MTGIEKVTEALEQISAEMKAGFGSSFGETREQLKRALPIAQRLEAALPKVVEALEGLIAGVDAGEILKASNGENPRLKFAREVLSTLKEVEGA